MPLPVTAHAQPIVASEQSAACYARTKTSQALDNQSIERLVHSMAVVSLLQWHGQNVSTSARHKAYVVCLTM